MDGRRESWATEAELHAASALYEMNIKVTRKLATNIRWLSHTFRANGEHGNNTTLPYANSIHLILKNCHFDLLQDCSMNKHGVSFEAHNKETTTNLIDWFELKSTTKGPISSVEPVTIQMKRKEKQNRTSGSKQTNLVLRNLDQVHYQRRIMLCRLIHG